MKHIKGISVGSLEAKIYRYLSDCGNRVAPQEPIMARDLGTYKQSIHRSVRNLKKKGLVDERGRPL